jgi:hypothetical protein
MRAALLAGAIAATSFSCGDEKKRTEVLLGIVTDLMAPSPLASVHIDVTRLPEGILIGQEDFTISGTVNSVYELPGTYAREARG